MTTEKERYPGYSRSESEAMALEYYKTCKPKAYRQMKRYGELSEIGVSDKVGVRHSSTFLKESDRHDFSSL